MVGQLLLGSDKVSGPTGSAAVDATAPDAHQAARTFDRSLCLLL